MLRLSERLPLTDEMRRQASSTIESLNERMGSLNQKAQQISAIMSEVTSLRNLFTMPKGAGSAGERLLATNDESAKRICWKSFSNAVKKRIDETSKYILPNEGTTDFALMYIASESVYYEAFIKDKQFGEENGLIDYALKKKVYPTSPQTIYPYLMTILQGMKALKIEENAKDILAKVTGLRNDYERFKSIYNNEAQGAITKLDQHISGLEHKAK